MVPSLILVMYRWLTEEGILVVPKAPLQLVLMPLLMLQVHKLFCNNIACLSLVGKLQEIVLSESGAVPAIEGDNLDITCNVSCYMCDEHSIMLRWRHNHNKLPAGVEQVHVAIVVCMCG